MQNHSYCRHRITRQLNYRAQHFKDDEIRHGKQAGAAESGVAQHTAVGQHAFNRAPLPTIALPVQGCPSLRHLGPAHRLRDEDDAIVFLLLMPTLVQPYDDLHVLAHRRGGEAARLH